MNHSALSELEDTFVDGLYFCHRVYALFESISALPDGRSRLRRRTSRVEKKLLEELLPVAKYVQANYRLGRYIAIRWKDGNQNYDAELRQEGAYVSENMYPATAFLEVVSAVHPNEHLRRELLDKEGFAFGLDGIQRMKGGSIASEPVSYHNREFVAKFSAIILKQLRAKSTKSYPANTSLIVEATLHLPYMPDDWLLLMSLVRAELPQSNFREIFVYDSLHMHSHVFQPRPPHDA